MSEMPPSESTCELRPKSEHSGVCVLHPTACGRRGGDLPVGRSLDASVRKLAVRVHKARRLDTPESVNLLVSMHVCLHTTCMHACMHAYLPSCVTYVPAYTAGRCCKHFRQSVYLITVMRTSDIRLLALASLPSA